MQNHYFNGDQNMISYDENFHGILFEWDDRIDDWKFIANLSKDEVLKIISENTDDNS